ncbi:MAG: hypothetical protein IIA67_02705 [Planctomycetes bacterium]|nr:hypothetical protein [Planctomycetota bacterium]
MKPNRSKTVEEYKLVSSFERVRATLLEEQYADRLDRPLAYWALPNDRRLPLAFLGHSLRSLLETPFEELSSTPGIGHKKIGSLVKLLARATKDHPPEMPQEADRMVAPQTVPSAAPASTAADGQQFDPTMVSEALWMLWRDAVRDGGQQHEKLGRLAPSLQSLPTVIWHTPLGEYIDRTVSEIRNLKTHGEKRVRVILEVYYVVHEMLATAGSQDHLAIRLAPRFILPIEQWINGLLASERVPSEEQIERHFVRPMLEQIHVDAGPTIARLAEGRLGTDGTPQSVRQQSRRMAVTRARVYQLLDDCGKVMNVRWPEGRHLLAALTAHLQTLEAGSDELRLYHAAIELFYPTHDRETENS